MHGSRLALACFFAAVGIGCGGSSRTEAGDATGPAGNADAASPDADASTDGGAPFTEGVCDFHVQQSGACACTTDTAQECQACTLQPMVANGVCECQFQGKSQGLGEASSTTDLQLVICGGDCRTPASFASDADNCGACGRACGNNAGCVEGICGPGPTTLVPASPGCGNVHLAAAGGTLYWTEAGHGTVNSVPTAGGPATTIASNEATPDRVRVTGTTLLWTAQPAVIREVALPDGQPTDLVRAAGSIPDFVVSDDAQFVYYLIGQSVMRIPITGGTPVEVARAGGSTTPQQLAISGNTLAFDCDVVTLADGIVASCGTLDPADPTGATFLGRVNCVARDDFKCGRIGSANEGLFFRDGVVYVNYQRYENNYFFFGNAYVQALSVPDMTGDADGMYIVDRSDPKSVNVEKIPYPPDYDPRTPPTVLARHQDGASSLTVDENNAYWSKDCAINSIAKR